MKDKHIILTVSIVILVSIPIASIISKNGIFVDQNLFNEKSISFERKVDVNKEILFNTFANLENYPKILPENYKSITFISEKSFMAKEIVGEKGIFVELDTKHTIIPYDRHIIEVISGDAKGTRIEVFFEEDGESTTLNVKMELKFSGILSPFNLIPDSSLIHAANTVIDRFVEYSKKTT